MPQYNDQRPIFLHSLPPTTWEITDVNPAPADYAEPDYVEPDYVAITQQDYSSYYPVGGTRLLLHPGWRRITRREAERLGMPFIELDEINNIHHCDLCALPILNGTACRRCGDITRRVMETRRAIDNGGRRFGIELEFSIPDDAGGDTCPCGHCRAARQDNAMLGPYEIAEHLTSAGVVCQDIGYSHEVMSQWKIVPDGSLSMGYELVSPPMQWARALREVPIACRVLTELGCEATSDCGLHVHHDVGDLSAGSAKALARNWQNCLNATEAFVAPHRLGSGWCHPLPSNRARMMCGDDPQFPINSLYNFFNIDGERYRQLNWTCWRAYGTVEVRMHESTLDPEEILAWIAYTQAIVEAGMSEHELPPANSPDEALDALRIRRAANPARVRSRLRRKAGISLSS